MSVANRHHRGALEPDHHRHASRGRHGGEWLQHFRGPPEVEASANANGLWEKYVSVKEEEWEFVRKVFHQSKVSRAPATVVMA